MSTNTIKNTVMRRVYYSFALSFVTQTVFWQGVFLGVTSLLLARWLHVASIVNNFLSVPVGSVPQYMFNSFWSAVTHGEVMTAITLVLAGGVAVSAGYHIAQALSERAGVWS